MTDDTAEHSLLAHLFVVAMVGVLILSPIASGVGPVGTASASDGIHYVTDTGFEIEDTSGGSALVSFPDDNTLDLPGIRLSSPGNAYVTLEQRTGTFTKLTNIDDDPAITVNPDDKQEVALMGGFDSLEFSDTDYALSNSGTDLVYDATSEAALRLEDTGLETGDPVLAIDVDSDNILDSATVASNGSVTFTALDAGSHAVNVRQKDTTIPSVARFDLGNPSKKDLSVTFDSNESLSNIRVELDGPETATISDFSVNVVDDTYIYFTTYRVSTAGQYTATLTTAADRDGNDGATGQTDTVTVDPKGPVFQPEITDSNSPVLEGETLNLTANVTNTGDRADTQTVSLTVGDHTQERSVSLDPGNHTQRKFSWQTEIGDAGNYSATVGTDNATALTDVRVESRPVEALSVSLGANTLEVGETTGATVTAEYSNGVSEYVTDEATLTVENTTVATVDNGTISGQAPGETTTNVTYEGKTATETLTVTAKAVPPTLQTAVVEDERPQTVVLTFDRSVTLTAAEETAGFTVTIDGEPVTLDGATATSQTVELSLAREVAPDEAVVVSYDGSDNLQSQDGATASAFEGSVTNTVDGPRPGEIGVLSYTLSTTDALVDYDTVTIEATVGNGLDEQATTTVPLVIDGETVDERSVTLDPGKTATVSFERTFSERGTVNVTVSDNNATTVEVFALDLSGNGDGAQDRDGDGLREDIDGDGVFSLRDVQLLFEVRNDPVVSEYGKLFDFAGDGTAVTLADVQALFEQYMQSPGTDSITVEFRETNLLTVTSARSNGRIATVRLD
jgi:hypothetical protein